MPSRRWPQSRSWYSFRFASNRRRSSMRRRNVKGARCTNSAPTQTPTKPALAALTLYSISQHGPSPNSSFAAPTISTTSLRTAKQKSASEYNGVSSRIESPYRRRASAAAATRPEVVLEAFGSMACSFHAMLVDGPASPADDVSKVAIRRVRASGAGRAPFSSSITTSVRVPRIRRLKHAGGPQGASVAHCGISRRHGIRESAAPVSESAPSGRRITSAPGGSAVLRASKVPSKRYGSAWTWIPIVTGGTSLLPPANSKDTASPSSLGGCSLSAVESGFSASRAPGGREGSSSRGGESYGGDAHW